MSTGEARGRIDWASLRDRIDLARVAADLLGPPPGRAGRGLWWRCPLGTHEDANPSFLVDADKGRWRCFGCGEHGDAAGLLMKVGGMTFPEAVGRLADGSPVPPVGGRRPVSPSRPEPAPEGPRGLPEGEALALVVDSEARLWSDEGAEVLAYLTGVRKLTPETIRAARIGWTPKVAIPKRDGGGWYLARGIVIPWFDGDRLALAKVRQPDGQRPKYAEAFRDRPSLFPGRHAIRAGRPLVVVEGEFDALLLGQELAGLACVVTLGGAANRPGLNLMGELLACRPWYLATDSDGAGDKAAEGWPGRARRVRPPGAHKDWTEARQAGVNIRRWWADRLAGVESPALFTWGELAAQRWGPGVGETGAVADDVPDPGDDPDNTSGRLK